MIDDSPDQIGPWIELRRLVFDCILEGRAGQVGASQIGASQVGASQVGRGQICAPQVGLAQVFATQIFILTFVLNFLTFVIYL